MTEHILSYLLSDFLLQPRYNQQNPFGQGPAYGKEHP